MADHNVILNYAASNTPQQPPLFAPEPNPIRVRTGHTIAFRLGNGPPDAKIRLTFTEPALFATKDPKFHSTGQFNDGDGDVTVVTPPEFKTSYHCELLVDGVVRATSKNAGGDVLPDGL